MTADPNDSIDAVIAAYLEAAERGTAPARDAVLAAHPPLADRLRAFFADFDAVGRDASKFRLPPPSLGDAETLGAGTPAAAPPPARVKYLGDYELLAEIARGGMGVVYRGRQVTLNRPVAVKMILAGTYATQTAVDRFRAEAEAAANLDHPNILPVYEVGEHDGHQYFSMKLVAGGSLAEKVEGLTADPRAAAAVLSTVARAVHFAHQRGVLHRDLKPANILLDADGTPYVSDFGLAKKVDADDGSTKTGAVVGTPSYMAPEQARGTKGLTTAADVYALGAMLFELLTGRPPFRGPTVFATLRALAETDAPDPRTLNPKADRDLGVVALKCLRKDPAARYASAAELADDLDRWARGEPIAARPVGRVERGKLWARRNPRVAGLLTAAVVFLVAGSAGSAYFGVRAGAAAAVARGEKARADENADAARRGEAAVRTQLARARVAEGNRLADADDRAGALLWYAAALGVEAENPERVDMHRRRIGTFFRHTPPLARVWQVEPGETVWAVTPTRVVVRRPGTKAFAVRDAATGAVTLGPVDLPYDVNEVVPDEAHGRLVVIAVESLPDDQERRHGQWWDLATGRPLSPLRPLPGKPTTNRFLADGSLLLDDQLVKSTHCRPVVWSPAAAGPVPLPVPGPADRGFHTVLVSPDGGRVFTLRPGPDGDFGKYVGQLSTAAGVPAGEPFSVDWNYQLRFVFSADSAKLVQWTFNGEKVIFRDGRTGAATGELSHPNANAVAPSPDGKSLILTGQNGVRVMTTHADGWPSPEAPEAYDPVVRPDGGAVAVSVGASAAERGLEIRIHPTSDSNPTFQTVVHPKSAILKAFTPDGRFLITADEAGTIRWWDLAPAEPRSHVVGMDNYQFNPPAGVVVGQSRVEVRVADLATGTEVYPPWRPAFGVSGAAKLLGDRVRLLVQGRDDVYRVRDCRTGAVVELAHGLPPVGPPIVSADETRALFTALDESVPRSRVVDLATGQPVGAVVPVSHIGITVHVSPGLKYALSAKDRRDHWSPWVVWDVANHRPVPLDGRTDPVSDADRIGLSDTKLAAMDGSGTRFDIWDLPSGRKRGTGSLNGDKIRGCLMTADGNRILVQRQVGPFALFDGDGNFLTDIPISLNMGGDPELLADGRLVLIAGRGIAQRVYHTDDGRPASPWLGSPGLSYVFPTPSADGRFVHQDGGVRESATGDPVLPPHAAPRWAYGAEQHMLKDGSAFLMETDPRTDRTWKQPHGERLYPRRRPVVRYDMSPDPRPVEAIQAHAELLAGRRIDETNSLVPLTPAEVLDRFRRVTPAAPPTARDWHAVAAATDDPFAEAFHLDRLLALDPAHPDWTWRRAVRYFLDGNREAAGKLYAAAAGAGQSAAEYHRSYAWFRHAAGDWAGAEAAFDRALAGDPFDEDSYGGRGDARMEQGRVADAVADFAAANASDPHFWAKEYVVALLRAGESKRAKAWLDSISGHIVPNVAGSAVLAGFAPGLDPDPAAAARVTESNAAEQFKRIDPDADVLFAHGGMLLRAGRPEAVAELTKAHAKLPTHAPGWAFLALAEAKRGRPAAAAGWLAKADAWLAGTKAGWVERAVVRLLADEARGELILRLHFPPGG